MCIFRHNWGVYTKPVDTGNHIYLAQFRSCKDCNKVQVAYLTLMKSTSICEVRAKAAIEALMNNAEAK